MPCSLPSGAGNPAENVKTKKPALLRTQQSVGFSMFDSVWGALAHFK
jgi:hypothetical protein